MVIIVSVTMRQEHSRSAVAKVVSASPGESHVRELVEQAAIVSCTEWCSFCNAHGGQNGVLCKPRGIHYCRVLAAYIAGKVGDAQLAAVQVSLGSPAPIPEMLLRLSSTTESSSECAR